VRRWHAEHPHDWQSTRRSIQKRYAIHGGGMRDNNGYELNTAGTVAALLYGEGDFVETLRTAFNFGWDADNNAATAATIVGVIKGHAWIQNQKWDIKDVYRNTTRDGMPDDETITRFGDRLIHIAGRLIADNGGEEYAADGGRRYRIRMQAPANVLPLVDSEEKFKHLRARFAPEIRATLENENDEICLARSAYLAVCLDLADEFGKSHTEKWAQAVAALQQQTSVVDALYASNTPAAGNFRRRMEAAGLRRSPKP